MCVWSLVARGIPVCPRFSVSNERRLRLWPCNTSFSQVLPSKRPLRGQEARWCIRCGDLGRNTTFSLVESKPGLKAWHLRMCQVCLHYRVVFVQTVAAWLLALEEVTKQLAHVVMCIQPPAVVPVYSNNCLPSWKGHV